MEKIIGILGGMGPEATVDLYAKIIRATGATRDQDHLRVIIDSNPKIPDRTAAILNGGVDPIPALVETACNLERAGADLIAMPCNTAHFFHAAVQKAVAIPILHMPLETAGYIRTSLPSVKRVGLLATTGTVKSGIYAEACTRNGLEMLSPDDPMQELVTIAIFGPQGIKAGGRDLPRQQLLMAAESLIARGVDAIILGCTEIPLALQPGMLPLPLVDATQILAEAAIAAARTADSEQSTEHPSVAS
ncbi:MAG: aspartate/glutamate racemase family protein [Bacillota bacterium]